MAIDKPLSHNQLLFIAEYCKTQPRNATQAYLRVYDCTPDAANANGARMLFEPRIKAEIEKWELELRTDRKIEAEWVISEILTIATADPADLINSKTGACRCCYGDGHKPMRTPEELRQAVRQYDDSLRRSKQPPDPVGLNFDFAGGVGYNRTLDPNPDCPECHGEGQTYETIKDTRLLSPGARRLYDGIKRTKDGVEVKIRDRTKMIEMASQHLGLLKTVNLHGGAAGAPPIAMVSTVTSDPVEAAKLYSSIMSNG